MMQFPRQKRFQIIRVNFGPDFNIKNAHARVLEKLELGKTQLKKDKTNDHIS